MYIFIKFNAKSLLFQNGNKIKLNNEVVMPEEAKREGVGGGGGGAFAPDLLRIRQYPDPSRPYSTESSGSSTFTQDNRSR